MKTLIFFRHGKSDWDADYHGDHNRPVAKRGQKAAQLMGRFLAGTKQVPHNIVTSSAVRAKSTVELAKEAGQWDCPVRVTDALYDASAQTVLQEIRAELDLSETLLLAGHEPTWSEMVSRLTGQCRVRFPTAAMARLDFDIQHWNEAQFGGGSLIWLVTPKLVKAILKS